MNNWKKVYTSPNNHQAEIVKGVLETHDLPAVIMNRKDSSYLFGYFEVFVNSEDASTALTIIANEISFR